MACTYPYASLARWAANRTQVALEGRATDTRGQVGTKTVYVQIAQNQAPVVSVTMLTSPLKACVSVACTSTASTWASS